MPRPTRAEARVVFGRQVILVLQEDGAGIESQAWLFDLDGHEGAVQAQRLYCFCPELLDAAGQALGVPVNSRGYWYEAGNA